MERLLDIISTMRVISNFIVLMSALKRSLRIKRAYVKTNEAKKLSH